MGIYVLILAHLKANTNSSLDADNVREEMIAGYWTVSIFLILSWTTRAMRIYY